MIGVIIQVQQHDLPDSVSMGNAQIKEDFVTHSVICAHQLSTYCALMSLKESLEMF